MSNKQPALLFYTGDWIKDPAVSACTPATRGIWIDLLCAMHELNRSGQLRGTKDQLSRIARCQTAEFELALTELQITGAADVEERNEIITITNRRMVRESKNRSFNALRQTRFRINEASNGDSNSAVTIEDENVIEVQEQVQKRKGFRFVQALRLAISERYKRGPEDRWSYEEERQLCEVAKRAKCVEELAEIVKHHNAVDESERKFLPSSVLALISRWNDHLDRARNYHKTVTKPTTPDRNKGTFNEGKAHLYANVGKIV